MNPERDLSKIERNMIPIWHQKGEDHFIRSFQVKQFADSKERGEQDRNMKQTSSTNQSDLEDLDPQEIEVEDDLDLAAIAAQLQETASYAINPIFKEKLREE